MDYDGLYRLELQNVVTEYAGSEELSPSQKKEHPFKSSTVTIPK